MTASPAPGQAPCLEAEQLRELGVERCVGLPPIVLEIGFGRAELILGLAAESPTRSFLGIGVGARLGVFLVLR